MARPTIVAWDGPLGATVTGVDLEVGLAPTSPRPWSRRSRYTAW